MNDAIERIFILLRERGANAYFSEAVTQVEHALQTAVLAERAGAPAHLIVAALLHDIGHLLYSDGENIADPGVDSQHENLGADWLAQYFDMDVTEPVRLHVAAKRYLCQAAPAYFDTLSAASQQSLMVQGGPMSAAEAEQFIISPYGASTVALRCWDDDAKVVGVETPPLEHFRGYLEALSRER